MKPRLLRSDLTGRVYVVTRYRERPNGVIEAITKYDVTDDFSALSGLDVERLAWAVHRGCTVGRAHPYEDGPDDMDRELAAAYADRYANPTPEMRAAIDRAKADPEGE